MLDEFLGGGGGGQGWKRPGFARRGGVGGQVFGTVADEV